MIRRPDSGFTLIELLAALAVGSLLLVLLGAMLGQLRAGWMTARQTSARVSQASAGIARLQALVAAGLPADTLAKEIAFEGDATSFRLRTLPPQAFAQMGVVWADVTVQRDRDGISALQVALSNDRETLPKQTVLRSAARLRLSYTMRDEAGVITQSNSVAATGRLPVSITLQTLDPRGQSVVEQIAFAPQNTVDGRCLFDPVSFACRM